MPTTLPRINTTWDRPTYAALHRISKVRRKSEAEIVSELVRYALELLEDMTDSEFAEDRLKTFDRSKALSTDQALAAMTKKAKVWGRKHI